MKLQENQEIFRAAIEKWGLEAQAEMLVEELAELILAVHKFFYRKQITLFDLAEGVADVEIMCEQMTMIIKDIHQINSDANDDLVAIKREEKLLRLKQLLQGD